MSDNTAQNGTSTVATDEIGGIHYQIVKNAFGALDTATLVSAANPMPTFSVSTGVSHVTFSAIGVASGTTTTETAITLTRSGSPGAATSSAASFVATTGKRLRLTSITVGSRGNSTGTAQVSDFSLRVNTAGAVTTSSNKVMTIRTGCAATSLAYDRVSIPLEHAGLEIVGDGTLQLGITANSTFVTNAPTWDVLITAIEV